MSRLPRIAVLVAIAALATIVGCASSADRPAGPSLTAEVPVDDIDADWIRANYVKDEYRIPMRDGVRLHTSVYRPRDTSEAWPMLMIRTPYGCHPYGENDYPRRLGLNNAYAPGGWIFVQQDVRGKYMSEGDFVNMRPHEPDKTQPYVVDESTDTFDTIEWLLANVEGHNGRVGMWGISYPGFYAAAGMIDAHPALRAVSPQAPIADWWQDDFKHNGAFFMPHAFHFLSSFGQPRPGPTTEGGRRTFEYGTPDGYDWYLNEMGTTRALNDIILKDGIEFWNGLIEHPDRDAFWARRDIVPHLSNVAPAVLTVGGWFDAEDLYGPLSIYRSVEARNPDADNRLIMGPWVHGGWHRTPGNALGSVHFGEPTSPGYLADVEMPFFEHHLKDRPAPDLAEATVFDTGANRWREFDAWPPRSIQPRAMHVRAGGGLTWEAPAAGDAPDTSFVSDPAFPVPFTEDTSVRMTREYMVDDQRFAGRRPDVLTFRSEPLTAPLTLAGPVIADLWVSTDLDDADWVVKLIDQQPGDAEDWPDMRRGQRRGGYQMMVRSEIIRGRYRNDPADPEPFERGEATSVRLPLQDVMHTFQPGHRVVIQIQSTWFPLVDRNPQRWVDNIFLAEADDYAAATHRVHHAGGQATRIVLPVLVGRD